MLTFALSCWETMELDGDVEKCVLAHLAVPATADGGTLRAHRARQRLTDTVHAHSHVWPLETALPTMPATPAGSTGWGWV